MFVLQPKPTFKAEVTIPVPGGAAGKIKFEFKHKGRKELKAFFDSFGEGESVRDDIDLVEDLVAGWEGVDQKFSREALEQLLDNYPGAALAIFNGYNAAYTEAKVKN